MNRDRIFNTLLHRSPLRLEAKSPEDMDWDRGYHHAKRGHPYDPTGAADPEAYKRGFQGAGGPLKPAEHYTRHLFKRLPQIASQMMAKHVDANDPRNAKFLQNPDSPAEHAPKWHQWGITTHTKMFGAAHDKDVVKLLQKWGLKDKVDQAMSVEIDGQPKRDLLKAAIALHDLGKYTHRTFETKPDGSYEPTFTDHEAKSGELIRSPEFAGGLKRDYGLTDNQVEYIARCAELHFELGILRGKSKKVGQYNMAFARSPQFPEMAREVMKSRPGYELEMGLLFLGDSMAKTDVRFDADSDEDITRQQPQMLSAVNDRLAALPAAHKFSPKLVQATQQMPVNIEVAKQYLNTWAADQDARGSGQIRESSRSRLRLLEAYLPRIPLGLLHELDDHLRQIERKYQAEPTAHNAEHLAQQHQRAGNHHAAFSVLHPHRDGLGASGHALLHRAAGGTIRQLHQKHAENGELENHELDSLHDAHSALTDSPHYGQHIAHIAPDGRFFHTYRGKKGRSLDVSGGYIRSSKAMSAVRITHYLGTNQHHDSRPAVDHRMWHLDPAGSQGHLSQHTQVHYNGGVRHRDGAPAYIEHRFHGDGRPAVNHHLYYQNDQVHRDNGPAYEEKRWDPAGNLYTDTRANYIRGEPTGATHRGPGG